MYADTITESMRAAIDETNRRRKIQSEYNRRHKITPRTVKKSVRDIIEISAGDDDYGYDKLPRRDRRSGRGEKAEKLSAGEREALIEQLTKEMKEAARRLEFEQAAYLRDRIKQLREQN